MAASAGSSPPHSQENPPKHGAGRGEQSAEKIGGDNFMFADDTFPSLPDFPCLSSQSSSTYSSSSSNSSSAYTNAAGAGGGTAAAGEQASGGEGFDALEDIDQILDFASLSSVPSWDSEPLFPDMGMMIEDAMSAPLHPVGDVPDGRGHGKAVLEGSGGEAACMDAAGDDLPRFFMEWLTSNRESISAEDLRRIRLRRSTIEAAAARLGGGRHGTMQLLKLILTWVQNHHLQKKRPRGAMETEAAGTHAVNSGYEFPSAGGQDVGAAGGASWWVPYQQFITSPVYGGVGTAYPRGAGQQQYTFHHPSCGTSSGVVNSQPFSPPAVGDMHAASGGNMSWPQQYVQFPGASTTGSSYPMPRVVPQPFSPGFAGQYAVGGSSQRTAGVEASATKEARKKRMARQRRATCLQQQRSQQLSAGQIQGAVLQQEPSPPAAHLAPVVTPSAGGVWGFWPTSGQQIPNSLSMSNSSTPVLQVPPSEAVAKPASSTRQSGGKADRNLRFLLRKVLKQSDVGNLRRIVLPKKEAEIHLPELRTRDGISIPMEDIGTPRVWNMRYRDQQQHWGSEVVNDASTASLWDRFWPNNKSRMYLLENTGDFVRSNELREGDFIVIYSDLKSGKYLIRGVKVRPAAQEQADGPGVLVKRRLPCTERAGASGSENGGGGVDDGTGKQLDGVCKSRPPHAAVHRARQEAAAMGQMTVSI